MTKIEILEMADLAALQPGDRSGVHNGSILVDWECRGAIRAVQTDFLIPEPVNHDTEIFL